MASETAQEPKVAAETASIPQQTETPSDSVPVKNETTDKNDASARRDGNGQRGRKNNNYSKRNRGQKRKRDGSPNNSNRETQTRKPRELAEGETREARRPKRKVAVCIGYCGTGYHGMQVNPPQKTIEGDLFKAFVDAGAISKDNADDPKKSSFIRAARTDKGVHAGGNVVSLKLIIEDEDIVEKINEHLPEQIRVWGYYRTNKSFECRKNCSSRIYEYLIPSFAFLPPRPTSVLAQTVEQAKKKIPGETREDPEGAQFWQNVAEQLKAAGIAESDQAAADIEGGSQPDGAEGSAEGTADLSPAQKTAKKLENDARRGYRISQERLELIREAFRTYEGVHNFHNFTIGKSFKDPSCSRFMHKLTVSEPKVINNTEWLSIKIHGQSFMLHQIRKMVGLVALVIRAGTPLKRISQAFGPTRINIPKAPALGLLLEQPVYNAYNRRLGDCGYDPITFDKWSDQIEAFKMKHIYDKIYTEEVKENVFHGFFSFLDYYRIDNVFDYLTARGITENSGAPVPQFEQPNDTEEVGSDTEG